MKKLFLIIGTLFFASFIYAAGPDDVNLIVSTKGKVLCKDIKLGLKDAKIKLPSGEVTKVALKDLNAYYLDGHIFEKRPLIVDNKVTNREVFMELVRYMYGMKIYKYNQYNENLGKFVNHFYIFKGEKFMGPITVENKETLLPFFRLIEN